MIHLPIFRTATLLTLLGWGTSALAQPISLGVRGGLNFSNASLSFSSFTLETSSRTVFGIGGVVEMGLSNLLSLQLEPRYIKKGATMNFTFFGSTVSSTAKFNYVELPVSMKINFDAGSVKPYLFAGPTLSILLSAEAEADGQTVDRKDNTASTEFSADFGGGLAYEIAPGTSLTGDLRYSLGLTNVFKITDPEDTSNWKSRDIKFLVGILFSL